MRQVSSNRLELVLADLAAAWTGATSNNDGDYVLHMIGGCNGGSICGAYDPDLRKRSRGWFGC